MRIYRRTPGVTAQLRRATDEDILEMELRHPDDPYLPALSALESYVLVVGEGRGGSPVGFMEYAVRDSELVVTGLWVEPSARGNGYGTIMLELAEATERPETVRVIAPAAAAGFYERRGYGPDADVTVMTKVCYRDQDS